MRLSWMLIDDVSEMSRMMSACGQKVKNTIGCVSTQHVAFKLDSFQVFVVVAIIVNSKLLFLLLHFCCIWYYHYSCFFNVAVAVFVTVIAIIKILSYRLAFRLVCGVLC